jgi:predicted ATPase/class 3 adenylate cyclase
MNSGANNLPTGTVTFFFSDIEDSTHLWEMHPRGMREALARHDEILRTAVARNGGAVIKTTGDGLHAVFSTAQGAAAAAMESQKLLAGESWPSITQDVVKVRIGIHTGEAQERDGDYFGTAVNRAARIMAIGHGGQVLLSSVTAALCDGQGQEEITLSDLGQVRLRGLARPEHVFQLDVQGLRAAFPPLRTDAAVSGNLPQQLTTFIGREEEKEAVSRLLSTTRLLTLTGPGGTGKTRLSLEVAGELQDRYANGAWLVELAPLSDPAAVPSAVAGLWDLGENSMLSLEQVLADYLRGKEILLILDNCEHLVAACARLAADLLAAAPRLTILASSREGLGITGETTYHLPTLRTPESDIDDLESLQAFESIQLFIDRARAVRPGFTLTANNGPAVGRIVRRLDGIPLAIELAAARLKILPPEQLAERLDDRFRLLTGGSRTALPRQQTLRALIDWSYNLLDEEERWFLRQMSVFAGGWTLEAAEFVVEKADLGDVSQPGNLRGLNQNTETDNLLSKNLASFDAFDLLANLLNKSLIVLEEEDGRARYNFLETIRQYARDRLFEAGEGPAARERHLDYFAAMVLENLAPGSDETYLTLYSAIGSPEMFDWVARMRPEIDNIRAAQQWALQSDPERALAMAIKLPFFFLFVNPAPEARQILVEALQAVEALDPAEGERGHIRRIMLLQGGLWNGNLLIGLGRNREAAQTLETVVGATREFDQAKLLAIALSLKALALSFLNDPAAYETAAEALAIFEKIGDERMMGMSLSTMAAVKTLEGDLETAQVLKERIKRLKTGEYNSLGNTLQIVSLAGMASKNNEFEEAEELLQLAREQFERLGSLNFRTMVESEIGHLRRRRGDDATAESIYRRTIRVFHERGHQAAVANQLEVLGFIAAHGGQLARAARLLGAAEALRERIHVAMLPHERVQYDGEVTALQEVMAGAALQKAWQAGRVLDIDAAVDLALSTGGVDENG